MEVEVRREDLGSWNTYGMKAEGDIFVGRRDQARIQTSRLLEMRGEHLYCRRRDHVFLSGQERDFSPSILTLAVIDSCLVDMYFKSDSRERANLAMSLFPGLKYTRMRIKGERLSNELDTRLKAAWIFLSHH